MLHLAEQAAPARRPRLHVGLAQCESEIREGTPSYSGQICVIGANLARDRLTELFRI